MTKNKSRLQIITDPDIADALPVPSVVDDEDTVDELDDSVDDDDSVVGSVDNEDA